MLYVGVLILMVVELFLMTKHGDVNDEEVG